MTDKQHPITPPPELVQLWNEEWYRSKVKHTEYESYFATRAAQWGADQELEACCEWMDDASLHLDGSYLRAARRPKPPSLKEQALALLEVEHGLNVEDLDLLRRALDQIDD